MKKILPKPQKARHKYHYAARKVEEARLLKAQNAYRHAVGLPEKPQFNQRGQRVMDIEEIIEAGWNDEEALDALTALVASTLSGLSAPIGTGKLIAALKPNFSPADYKILVNRLSDLRKQHPDDMWEYTGKKNRFGKQAIHWVIQATATLEEKDAAEKEFARRKALPKGPEPTHEELLAMDKAAWERAGRVPGRPADEDF